MAIDGNQVRTYLGDLKADGSPVFGNLATVIDTKLPIASSDDISNFTLATDADNHTLASGEYPAGVVYIDGTTYEALDGGFATKDGATLGTNAVDVTGQLLIDNRIVNAVRILDAENDEFLQVEFDNGKLTEAKYIYGFMQTADLTDGDVTADDKLQLSFGVYDDATMSFVPYELPAGDYKFEPIKIFTLGTASDENALAGILSGTDPVGGVALDELKNLVTKPVHGYVIASFKENYDRQGLISVRLSADATVKFYDNGVEIPATVIDIIVEGDLEPRVKKTADNAGKKAIHSNVRADLNGATLRADRTQYAELASDDDIVIDYDEASIDPKIYKDSYIQLAW